MDDEIPPPSDVRCRAGCRAVASAWPQRWSSAARRPLGGWVGARNAAAQVDLPGDAGAVDLRRRACRGSRAPKAWTASGSITSRHRPAARSACTRSMPPTPIAKAPLMLFLHGARQYLGRSVFRIEQMRELGFSVLAIDYRGFGASTDELPSETGVIEDAAAAWRWLGERHPEGRRYLFGHSLGGAIALQLGGAPRRRAGSGRAARRHRRGHLHVDPRHVQHLQVRLAADFDADHRALRFPGDGAAHQGAAPRRPRQRRSLVPSRFGRLLYERATATKRFVLVDGGTHTTTSWRGAEQYRAALREFFGLGPIAPSARRQRGGRRSASAAPASSGSSRPAVRRLQRLSRRPEDAARSRT